MPDTSLSNPSLAVSLSSSLFGFYCHAGFMAELHRNGFLPGQMAGASSGALAALLCGTGLRGQALEDFVFQRGMRRSFWDFGPGIFWRLFGVASQAFGTGFLTGNNIARFMHAKLGPQRLEELRDPRVQIAVTNLTDKRSEIVTTGDAIAYAVASCSMPGLIRARRIDGRVWCDGGTTDVVPFEHWLTDGSVETIVLHEIVHEHDGRPRAPGGGMNVTLAMATCHEIISDRLLSYRLQLAESSGQRLLHVRTLAPHPGFFPGNSRYILCERGRASARQLCEQLRGVKI